ncbi:serine hydrolase domain-containing protein [Mesoplasma florum]|uniref:serine hydrolase domain-containing protein n=1 Tax=Mesoplasma florum TaxID=2151 RepID=UPI000BE3EC8D|nr:serine hydrolase domain-containing protein [Mesoplasma florum]ATI73858.1 serine hydrolase [Mesoplasma florum]
MNWKNTENKLNEFIDNKLFNGVVLKITNENKTIYFNSFGYSNLEEEVKMNNDNIFALYSMTKPITVIACLLLIQRGLLSFEDKICDFYSDFNEEIKIKHLLNMTSGLTYFWNNSESGKEIKDAFDLVENENISLQNFCEKISKAKVISKPGAEWHYGVSLDIIGGIIEKISNQGFNDFVNENILAPLEMQDTAFYIKDLNRKTQVYEFKKTIDGNKLVSNKDFHFLMPFTNKQPAASLGGSGLFSTADDYSKFLNFLIDGKINGIQYLESELLEEMRSDQLKDIKETFKWTFNKDYSYGYGIRVRLRNELDPLTEIGEFGWDGALGSAGLVDPKNNITMTFLSSSYPGNNRIVQTELFGAVYKDLRELNIIK